MSPGVFPFFMFPSNTSPPDSIPSRPCSSFNTFFTLSETICLRVFSLIVTMFFFIFLFVFDSLSCVDASILGFTRSGFENCPPVPTAPLIALASTKTASSESPLSLCLNSVTTNVPMPGRTARTGFDGLTSITIEYLFFLVYVPLSTQV